ncbi:MAG: glycine C-acetyltransferase [Planctomycetota bacterium]
MADRMAFLQEEIDDLKKRGVFSEQRVLDSPQLPVSIVDGKEVINLSSNNYLGLATHPKAVQAAIEATKKWGVGAGAVRPIVGTMRLHVELEDKLAWFKETESALVFVAGIAANRGTIQALLPSDQDYVISDELNHASIIDGVRLSKAKRDIYKHSDMNALEDALKRAKTANARRTMIITDGVFSMDGDIALLDQIAELADKYNAFTFVDDAHAAGVLGKNGRGTVSHFNLKGKWDIQMGTLSKGMGVLGGYIAGPKNLTDYLRHNARPFLFSTAHPPAVPAALLAIMDVMLNETEIFDRLWNNTKFFKEGLKKLGYNTGNSTTPITPVIIGEEDKTMKFMRKLYEKGVMGVGIVFPTVPRGTARVRTIVTAAHTKEQLQKAIDIFEEVGKEFAII